MIYHQNGTCKYNPSEVVTKVVGHFEILEGCEKDLQHAVATQGPVAVSIDAGHEGFWFYSSGMDDLLKHFDSCNLLHGSHTTQYHCA